MLPIPFFANYDKAITLVSDSIFRTTATGPLVGTRSDSFKGGKRTMWEGTVSVVRTASDGTIEGSHATSPGTAFHSTTVNVGRPDMSFSVKMLTFPTNTTLGVNAAIDFRKVAADTGDCYRLVIYGGVAPAGLMRLAKRVSGTVTYLSDTDIPVNPNDYVRMEIKGSEITIFVNDVSVLTATDTSIPAGNYCGFASATTTAINAYSFKDVVVKSII